MADSLDVTQKKLKQIYQDSADTFDPYKYNQDPPNPLETIKYIESDSLDLYPNPTILLSSPNSPNSLPKKSSSSLSQNTVVHNTIFKTLSDESSPKLPKKVEKVPISAFTSILRSKNPSFSIESDEQFDMTEKIQDFVERQKFETNSESKHHSAQVSKLDFDEEQSSVCEENVEFDRNLEIHQHECSEESSEYSDPEESLKKIVQKGEFGVFNFIERPCAIMIENSEISEEENQEWDSLDFPLTAEKSDEEDFVDNEGREVQSDKKLEEENFEKQSFLKNCEEKEAVGEKNGFFESEILGLIRFEVSEFLFEVNFATRFKEVDPSTEYINRYIEALKCKANDKKDDILLGFNKPFSLAPLCKLEMIQTSEIGTLTPKFEYELLLPLEFERYVQRVLNCTTDAQAWYCQLIFGALNEALCFFRPFGFCGEPDPWQDIPKILYKEDSVNRIFMKARERIEKWESLKVGMYPVEICYADEEKLQNLRDNRLNLILFHSIEEDEPSWITYYWEETQSKLDLSNLIFDFLLIETSLILSQSLNPPS